MNSFIVLLLLLILLLMKLYWRASKKLKATSHDAYNLLKKQEIIDELETETFELKRKMLLLEYRIEQSGKEVLRQKKINLAMLDYYETTMANIQVPVEHARFFDYSHQGLGRIFTFSEN